MDRSWRLRAAVLTLAGVLAVHHGRYRFAPPEHAHALAGVHGYLGWLTPVAGALLFLATVHFAARLADPGRSRPRLPGVRTLWAAAGAALLTVFGAQECVEHALVDGHLPTFAELLGSGGWTAIPLAALAAGAIALLLRGAAAALRWAVARRRARPRRAPWAPPAPAAPVLPAPRKVLARRLAGRGPPLSA